MKFFSIKWTKKISGRDREQSVQIDGTEQGDAVAQYHVSEDSPINQVTYGRASQSILLAVILLLPIIFIPALSAPFQFTKTIVVLWGVLLALVMFLITSLKIGVLAIPTNKLFFSVWLLPFAYLVSSIFSENYKLSLFGRAFDIDTFSFMALMALMVTLVVLVFRKKDKILAAYLILFLSFIVMWVFQALRLVFGPDLLSLGVLTQTTSSVFGTWNDMGIFFGLATVMILITLASMQLSVLYKRILYGMLAVSLVFLAIVNFTLAWMLVGFFALGFFVYSIAAGRFNWGVETTEEEISKYNLLSSTSVPPLVVLIISAIFVLGGSSIGNILTSYFNTGQIEARPSLQSTVSIGKEVYKDNPFFGSGPNTFVKQWILHKELAVNNTIFWNADFTSGVGLVPTSFVTTGLLGIFAWLVFLGSFLYNGFQSLVANRSQNRFANFLSLSSFLGALYLWVLSVVYTPSLVLTTLAFFFTGLFIATLRHSTSVFQERVFDFTLNPRTGFISVLVLTVLLLLSTSALYMTGKTYIAATLYQNGIVEFNINGNLDEAEKKVVTAATLSENDRYSRLLADISITRIRALQNDTSLSETELQITFQNLLRSAIGNSTRAIEIDETNYENWLSLGRVYESIVPIEGAYENAKRSYENALELNPTGPAIYLTLARLEVVNGDNDSARNLIGNALQVKENFTEAIFLLSQIEIEEGNIDEAIASVEAASILDPNNQVVFFQLGLLRYNQENYSGAISAFEDAINIDSNYSNARYFLGLSYYEHNRINDALEQFKEIEKFNQDNSEIKAIISNLENGRSPLSESQPPPPEQREELPIEEGVEI